MKSSNANLPEKEILARLAVSELEAFERLFNQYYKVLCRFAPRYVHTGETAEELITNVLTTLWLKRQAPWIASSLQAYLGIQEPEFCFLYYKVTPSIIRFSNN